MKTTLLMGLAAVLLRASPALAETPPEAAAAPAAAPAAKAEAPAALDAAGHARVMDELWKKREPNTEGFKQNVAAVKAAVTAFPEDAGVLWRASRWSYWEAEMSTVSAMRERSGKAGWDLAEKSLLKDPSSLEAHHWAAVNCGTYGDAIGVLKALTNGIEGKLRKHLDLVVEKKPSYENGGPLVTLGRYYFKLPWPKHDAKKSIEALRGALKIEPRNGRAKVFLAEVLLDEDSDNAKDAMKLVDEVIALPLGAYDAPEEAYNQRLAKELKPKIQEKLK